MTLEIFTTCLALVVLACCAAIAVFHPLFDDTVLQRISLAGICVFSLASAWQYWRFDFAHETVQSLIWCVALYGIETTRKIRCKHGNT